MSTPLEALLAQKSESWSNVKIPHENNFVVMVNPNRKRFSHPKDDKGAAKSNGNTAPYPIKRQTLQYVHNC